MSNSGIKGIVIIAFCSLFLNQVMALETKYKLGSTIHYKEYGLSHWKVGLVAVFSGDCSLLKNTEHMQIICISVNGNDVINYTLIDGNTDKYFFKKHDVKHQITPDNLEKILPASVNFYKPVLLLADGTNSQIIYFDIQ